MMSADDVRKPRVHTQLHDRICDYPPKIYCLEGNKMDFQALCVRASFVAA